MKTIDEPLSFEKLDRESIVVELRYPYAYLFWDRAGQIFEDLKHRLPPAAFELTNASPGAVAILYDSKYEINVLTQRFSVGCSGTPLDLKSFLRVATSVFEVVVSSLQLELFTRIGLRQVFVRQFPTLINARDALSQLPAFAMLVKPLEGRKNATVSPSANVRVEGDSEGTLFSLKAAERDFTVNMPPVFWDSLAECERRTLNFHHSLLMFDIDAYTTNDVLIDQFDLTEWTKQRIESVKKEASAFFQTK